MGRQQERETHTLVYPPGAGAPRDWLRFIQLDGFVSDWRELGLDDEDLRKLEVTIMFSPKCPSKAPVISDTGGLRKFRFSPQQWKVGKSGGVRVIYLFLEQKGCVVLLAAYAKGVKEDLTSNERKQLKQNVSVIEAWFYEGKQGTRHGK